MKVETQPKAEGRGSKAVVYGWPIFAASLMFLIAPAAHAGPVLPTGAVVKAGTAAVSAPSPAQVTVTQTSSKAIIDWTGFSIGQGGTVQVNNGSGATLNRVTGAELSSIDGLLSATGSVYLINPNGVVIGKTGVVNTGGTFVASTLDVSDANFLAGGDLTFAGTSSAGVVNLGKIGALGGDVALIAAKVDNEGSITAANGAAGLIAGYQVVIHDGSLDGGKFAVLAGGPSTSATNTGALAAAEAELRANGGNVYALAGNTGGVIKATGVAAGGGKVVLYAEGGTATANGEIDAANADGSGGQVETSGASVNFDGLRVKAANWLIDPTDLTVDAAAAATISANLAGTSVTLQTTASGASGPGNTASGAGDINVNAPISWSSGSTLTLDAYNSININAPITVAGPGKVAMTTNDGGSSGDLGFGLGPSGFAGSVAFTGTPGGGQGLTINGQSYTLVYSLADLAAINASNAALTGDYALAGPIDASSTLSSGWTPIGSANAATTGFSGVFEGLGNTIANLHDGNAPANYIGLFATNSGVVRDVGLTGATTINGSNYVGGLAGENSGTVTDAYSTLSISGVYLVGGLVGNNDGQINNAFATGGVSGNYLVGGLVGANAYGVIGYAYATGAVNGGDLVGGLVGGNSNVINNAYATGAVRGGTSVGGLVGNNYYFVTNSYSTGSVTGSSLVGGLVGLDDAPELTINSHYDVAQVTINGAHAVTVGALYDAQYQDWFTHGLTLNIANYFAAPDANGVYSINSLTDLENLLGFAGGSSLKFKLTADIDLTSAPGFYIPYFAGASLDGGGHVVSNIAVSVAADDVGFIGYLDGGAVTNLGLVGGQVSGAAYVGGLIGYAGTGTVSGVYATNAVTGTGNDTGGLAGYTAGSISNAYATGAVAGLTNVGGLAGDNEGSISNAHATGSVSAGTGAQYVGGLVGVSRGNETNVYATGSVTAGQNATFVGGLLGINQPYGTVSEAYATGSVYAGAGSVFVGGLTGDNQWNMTSSFATGSVVGDSAVGGLSGWNVGHMTNVYATGAVTGFYYVGGLVGFNDSIGTIQAAYATGLTIGSASTGASPAYAAIGGGTGYGNGVGGLVGYNNGGSLASGYWNTQTTGQGAGVGAGSSGGTGLTAAQLQGALPSGFDPTVWGTGPGLYPYLETFYPTQPPEKISGYAYLANGSAAADATIGVYTGGGLTDGGAAVSGANGYYYYLASPNTVGSTTPVGVTETLSGGGVSGLTYTDRPTLAGGGVTGLNVTAGTIAVSTVRTTLSSLNTDLSATFGGAYAALSESLLRITASGGFTVDQSLSAEAINVASASGSITLAAPLTATGAVVLTAANAVMESGGGAIIAASLGGAAGGYVALNGANQIGTLNGFTNTGAGGFGLTDTGSLIINGALNAGSGGLSLHVGGSGLLINAPINAGGTTSIQSQGALAFFAPITIGGALQMYAFGGAITEAAGGVLSAPSLSGGGQGLSLTNGANMIGALNGFGRTGASDTISLTDGEALTIGGAVSAGTGTISINAPGVIVNAPMTAGGLLQISSTQSISISASLTTGGNVSLTDHGLLTELGSGLIWSVGLTANSTGAEALIGANHVSQILGISTNGAVNFNDIVRLEVDGPISVGTGNLTLTGTTTGGIYLDAPVTVAGSGTFSTPGGIVFNSSAAFGGALSVTSTTYGVSEGPAGTISAPSLTGSAVAGLDLMGANQIGSIAGYTTPGNFNFTDSTALQVTGALTASGEITLISGGNLVVAAPVSAPSTITLTSGGEITEPTPGQITTHTIYVKAKTGVDLTGPNVIVTVGGDSTVSGPNVINR
jgi:filamentous hemagglutinin family protein